MLNKKNKYIKGFTLIEILIALAIIALATTALLGAISSSITQAEKLSDKTNAHFVAQNMLNSVQLKIISMKLANGKMSGTKKMGNSNWYWTITITTEALKNLTNIEIFKIKVDVAKDTNKKQIVDTLISYAPIYKN